MTSLREDASGCTETASHPVTDELRELIDRGDFAGLLRRSPQLARQVRRSDDQEGLAHALGRLADAGPVAAVVAIESLVGVAHHHADDRLVDLLADPELVVRRHAAWRLGDREPDARALQPLLELLVAGGISTMHAHRTLRRWAAASSPLVARAVVAKLSAEESPAARARVVDLLGAIGGDTDQIVFHLALDTCEAPAVRAAAIGALGQRRSPAIDAELLELAAFDDTVATEASLALSTRPPERHDQEDPGDRDGLRIAQLALMGGLDGQLSRGGRGDTGGVASLLVSLGAALARHDDVDHVMTIGRGTLTDAVIGSLPASRSRSSFEILAFGDESRLAASADEAWEHLPAIERGLRRALQSASPVDMLHLRMADAGALVGAEVASELGVPICFSVAPDPHNVIESLQGRGELDVASFVRLESETHVWFRARLIERIAREADRLALFPRSKPIEFLEQADGERQRRSVVAEGIDVRLFERARAEALGRMGPAVRADVLDDLAAAIPASRRGLPLMISVGRLHPVKGMDRVVSAWAGDPNLHETCNLVIVGGDLDAPSATEGSVLDAIDRAVRPTSRRREGLILLGGRPRADIATLLTSTVTGHADSWVGGGVYVDGALKEEFGLAVLEALAAGLVVVAPSTGGPSTYVEDGDTGVLVDPGADLGAAMQDAFALVTRGGRVERARAIVERRYSVDTMAAQLVELYRPAMAMR